MITFVTSSLSNAKITSGSFTFNTHDDNFLLTKMMNTLTKCDKVSPMMPFQPHNTIHIFAPMLISGHRCLSQLETTGASNILAWITSSTTMIKEVKGDYEVRLYC